MLWLWLSQGTNWTVFILKEFHIVKISIFYCSTLSSIAIFLSSLYESFEQFYVFQNIKTCGWEKFMIDIDIFQLLNLNNSCINIMWMFKKCLQQLTVEKQLTINWMLTNQPTSWAASMGLVKSKLQANSDMNLTGTVFWSFQKSLIAEKTQK